MRGRPAPMTWIVAPGLGVDGFWPILGGFGVLVVLWSLCFSWVAFGFQVY